MTLNLSGLSWIGSFGQVRSIRITLSAFVAIFALLSLNFIPIQAKDALRDSNQVNNSQVAVVTHYLDAQSGSDNNPGTQAQPWRTIPKAIASLAPGDTLIFNSGIYMLDSTQTYIFGPSGIDVNHKTTYIAAAGARVIITNTNSTPPTIQLGAYMHVEGLWFGGTWDTTSNIDAFGNGGGSSPNPNFVLGGPLNDVINNTFFGYGNICCGHDYLFFQGNRSVRTGAGSLSHGMYLSGHDGTTNQEDNHAIVDNNLFIGQAVNNPYYGKVAGAPATYLMGLGIQVWHAHNNDILTRNFVTYHLGDTIGPNNDPDMTIRSELVANNFWWRNGQNDYPDGFWLNPHTIYEDNLGGPGGGVATSGQPILTGNTFATNAFTLGSPNYLPPNSPVVTVPGPFALSETAVAAAVGTTPATIDQAIAALQNSFSIGINGWTIQSLYQDQTVEANFAKLKFTTQTSSSLYQTGTAWFNSSSPLQAPVPGSVTNVGPGASVPSSPGYFWAAFRALGMKDYDDSAHRMIAPYPTYPYPLPTPVKDTIGVFAPSTGKFYLRDTNNAGGADITVAFNPAHKPYPVVGDWNGFGVDTVGIYDQSNGLFSLCHANGTTSCANSANITQLALGNPNDLPVAGRWTLAAGHDGTGVFRPSNGLLYLKDMLTSGYADYTMVLGIPGDMGIAGDWNGDGLDSPGIYRPSSSTFYMTNQVQNGSVYGSYAVTFGVPGETPIAADWIAQGYSGVGVFKSSQAQVYLKNALSSGYADNTFAYGAASEIPVAGYWGAAAPAPNPTTNIIVASSGTSLPPSPGVVTGASGNNGLGD